MSNPFNLDLRRSKRKSKTGTLRGLLGPSLLVLGVFLFAMGSLLIQGLHRYSEGQIQRVISIETYRQFVVDPYQWRVLFETLKIGGMVTFLCLIIGYPVAYALTRIKHPQLLITCYVIIFSPLLVSVVVRAYGWLLLLSNQGVVNFLLKKTGMVHDPVQLMFNSTGVIISMVHILLAFMVFPIVSVLRQLDPRLKEAAKDLGANRIQTFLRVVFPLSITGIVSGCQTVFVLSISAFVTPALLGGGRVNVLGYSIYRNTVDLNWPLAAVQATVLLVLVLAVLFVFNRLMQLGTR